MLLRANSGSPPSGGAGGGLPYDTFLQIMLIKLGDVNDLAMSNI